MEYALALLGGRIKPSAPEFCPENVKPFIDQCFSFEPEKRPSASDIIQILSDS